MFLGRKSFLAQDRRRSRGLTFIGAPQLRRLLSFSVASPAGGSFRPDAIESCYIETPRSVHRAFKIPPPALNRVRPVFFHRPRGSCSLSALFWSIGSEGRKPGGLRHRDEKVGAGPGDGRAHPKGDGAAALEALHHCLRSEGFLPRNPLLTERLACTVVIPGVAGQYGIVHNKAQSEERRSSCE